MRLSEFVRGGRFFTDAAEWICTDIGTRTICAISANHKPEDLNGPPYSVAEICFDEDDMEGCEPQQMKDKFSGANDAGDCISWDEYKSRHMSSEERKNLEGDTEILVQAIQAANKYEYSVGYSADDRVFVARCAEMPGLAAHGEASQDALAEIQGVTVDALAMMMEHDDPIPEPKRADDA